MKNRAKRKFIIYILFICLAFFTVVFASLTTVLNINGTIVRKGASWNIYFTNVHDIESVGDAFLSKSNISILSGTSLNFSAVLNKPGDSASFLVDIVNSGTLDAKISSFNLTGLSSLTNSNIIYSLSYQDGTSVAVDDILKSNHTVTLKIKVMFDPLATSVSSSNLNLSLGANIIYEQYDGEDPDEEAELFDDGFESLYNDVKTLMINYHPSSNTSYEFDNNAVYLVDTYGNKTKVIDAELDGNGEIEVNNSNQMLITMYDDTSSSATNVSNSYGSDDLISTPQIFTRDVLLYYKNLSRLEALAEAYIGAPDNDPNNNYIISKSDWMTFYYIAQMKYTGTKWNLVMNSEPKFVVYVTNNGSYLKNYFTNLNSITINGDTIDVKHMHAVLAALSYDLYQSECPSFKVSYNDDFIDNNNRLLDSTASWGGDLNTLITDNIISSTVDKTYNGYYTKAYQLIGASNTSFAMDDLYADIDAWDIFYNLTLGDLTIYDAFYKFYSGDSNSGTYYTRLNRYTAFYTEVNKPDRFAKPPRWCPDNMTFDDVVEFFTSCNILNSSKWSNVNSTISSAVKNAFIDWINAKMHEENL